MPNSIQFCGPQQFAKTILIFLILLLPPDVLVHFRQRVIGVAPVVDEHSARTPPVRDGVGSLCSSGGRFACLERLFAKLKRVAVPLQ